RDTVMATNAFVWIDNPSVSVFIYTLTAAANRPRSALSPMTPSRSSSRSPSRSPREHTKIHCAGIFSPRGALVEDISSGSSLPASYGKD
ncbi:MAG: hypothetical protein ABSG72_22960, partial [Candidatus Sulfotelmatobacter sp.]